MPCYAGNGDYPRAKRGDDQTYAFSNPCLWGLMKNESGSWEIRAAILRGWTAQTFHIDRDLRLWFPKQANRCKRCADHKMPSILIKSRTIERNHGGDDWVGCRIDTMNFDSIWMWQWVSVRIHSTSERKMKRAEKCGDGK
jgi:hypothetical protein